MIIVSKNPIHSILYLILVFCNITFVLIILGVEFIAIIFLIVYVGAIAVLFLFVVMMLNIKILELDEVF
jgi:NADH:ubiquinone oxidoreductase subunit 6 (subunit J)